MQAIMEMLFDIFYLSTVITVGIMMIKSRTENTLYKLFGIMAVTLGFGDAFHLVPRVYGLLTEGLEANATALGIGKMITSVTMTVFYIILYHIWQKRYNAKNTRSLTAVMYSLAVARIFLCLAPQNEWTNYHAPLSWGIYRNIPFAVMGLIIIVIFYKKAKENKDYSFKYMWFAVMLSFAFYIPVVLLGEVFPMIGILMIPKTCAYVWVVFMGYKDMKK